MKDNNIINFEEKRIKIKSTSPAIEELMKTIPQKDVDFLNNAVKVKKEVK